MEYSKEQKRAILHKDGPMMVLAGPGSGKTTVIIKRIQNLICEQNIDPDKILVITFSKAASVEMKERFHSLINNKKYGVWFGTFHAVFFHILRHAYHYDSKNIITPILKKRLLEEAVRAAYYETEDMTDFLTEVENEISRVKGEGVDVSYYYSAGCPEEVFRDIYTGYEERLRRHRLIDFDDMICMTYELLNRQPDILTKWRERFSYILIDEFQDINRLQYETVKLLAAPENNLFIVGDDDQSIYGFRGAKPGIMLRFPNDFPAAKQVTLGINYRCSKEIMTAASRLISTNVKRYKKDLEAGNGKIDAVRISKCGNIVSENRFILDHILKYRQNGISYREMAVLFRTNHQAGSVAAKLMEFNIPFVLKETLPNIFEHFIAGDIRAYFEMAMGSRERALFLRVANRPKRYFSRESFDSPTISFSTLYSYYRDKSWMRERIDRFRQDLTALKNMPPFAAIDYIRNVIGYDEFLKEYADSRKVKADDWIELLNELQETTRDMCTFSDWYSYIEEYEKKLEENRNSKKEEKAEGIQLLTMHRAKGLEFDIVFIPDVNEGITPYRKAAGTDDVEEERRMFYVAMTRARKHLHLLFLEERYGKECEPSRFLFEISKQMKSDIIPKG